MHLLHIVGARPNFMKVAPVLEALNSYRDVSQTLIHTGQHYDKNMSDVFFEQLGIPRPDVNLEVGSGTHAYQTAHIMLKLEEYLLHNRPDRVIVYGDVNSTVAAALVCAKLLIPIDHVEAGLRSQDLMMPEEINRLVTDRLATFLFTPSQDGNDNLLSEGIPIERIHLVGNVMIDTLIRMLPYAEAIQFDTPSEYILATLHRPSNTDQSDTLRDILHTLAEVAHEIPVIFPIHPRTRSRLAGIKFDPTIHPGLQLWEPLGYIEFLKLQKGAKLVITDSGGVQEETTYLRVPCLTLRDNTERPVTVSIGSNLLIGQDVARLRVAIEQVLRDGGKRGEIPPLWDGHAGERIAAILTAQDIV